VRFLLPPRMCLRRVPSSRRTCTPTPQKHPGLFRQPLEYSTIVMATWSAAALAASNDFFIRSTVLYARGRKRLITSSEFAKNIKERDTIYWVQGLCLLTVKSLLLVSSPNSLTEKKPNSSFRTAVENLSRIC